MLAFRAESADAPLRLERVPLPELGAEDVLVKVAVAGITPGTLKFLRRGRAKVPTTVGHEGAGTVAAIGQRAAHATTFAVGDRVRVHPYLGCRRCDACRGQVADNLCDSAAMIGFTKLGERPSPLYDEYHDGTVAEYVRLPSWLLDPLPDAVPFDVAAKVADAATALRALKLAELPPDATVVIAAPTGAMGTLTLRLAERFRVRKIVLVGRDEQRLEHVRRVTTIETAVVVSEEEEEEGNGEKEAEGGEGSEAPGGLAERILKIAPGGVHAIIDYTPVGESVRRMLRALGSGGTLVHMGGNPAVLTIPLMALTANAWRLVGGRGHRREDSSEILRLLGERKLEFRDLITHRFTLQEAHKALEAMENRKDPVYLSVIEVE